jgi:hypothetical protein
MPRAYDLLKQGRSEELWQMCCGYLDLDIKGFMEIQERLLVKQLELLNNCALGKKLFRGKRPENLEEFRRLAPITTYKDYCPELLEKQEDTLPAKPVFWAHTAGRTGDYSCKWAPLTEEYAQEISKVLFAIGIYSGCDKRGDTSHLPLNKISILYSVAPAPYISGTFADLIMRQWPVNYLPSLNEAQEISFEERIKLGFKKAMTEGFDYFFGLSLILMNVGEKIRDESNKASLKPYLGSPKALWRLLNGKIRSKIEHRPLLPRDLWKIKGIIGSGTDSFVYKDKIKELWGRNPLDLYACTEGGIIASQTWDYSGMTFVPNVNFLEFIPEDENFKWQMDSSYKPKTLLLNEVRAGENYEIVITSFHGGAFVRYKIGDMIKIESLRNNKLGIDIPQMAFERRVDDFIDFYVINLTERSIWQAIEDTGVPYVDWIAYKDPLNMTLNLSIELKEGHNQNTEKLAKMIYNKLTEPDNNKATEVTRDNDLTDVSDFKIKLDILPKGTFAKYISRRRAEGADIAHLKPPHVNPSDKVLSILTDNIEDAVLVGKPEIKTT